MRTIKYLAFHKKEKKMCRVIATDFIDSVTVRFPEFEGPEFGDEYNDEMLLSEFEPLMQYTGFKYNGREIFDKFVLGNETVVCFDTKQGKWKAVPFTTYVCNAGSGGWTGYDLYSYLGEVMGDVYQNKELIKEE